MTKENHQDLLDLWMLSHCAPIFFLPREGAMPEDVYANGTASLLVIKKQRFLVTCAHVLAGFEEYKKMESSAVLCIVLRDGFGSPIVIPIANLHFSDIDLDIALFRFEPTWSEGDKEFLHCSESTVHKASPRDAIACLGFTGAARLTFQNLGLFPFTSFGFTITDISARRILLANTSPRHGSGGDEHIGGMSGSPAYALTPEGPKLTGFLTEGRTLDDSIYLTHAQLALGAILNQEPVGLIQSNT